MPLVLSVPEILTLRHGVRENAAKNGRKKLSTKRKNSNILQYFIFSRNHLNYTSMEVAGNGYEEPYKFLLQNARNSFA